MRTSAEKRADAPDASAVSGSDAGFPDADGAPADLSALREEQAKEAERKKKDRERKRAKRSESASSSSSADVSADKPAKKMKAIPEPVQIAIRTLVASVFTPTITEQTLADTQASALQVTDWYLGERLPDVLDDKWMPEVALGSVWVGAGVTHLRYKRAMDEAKKHARPAPPKKPDPEPEPEEAMLVDPATGQPVPSEPAHP